MQLNRAMFVRNFIATALSVLMSLSSSADWTYTEESTSGSSGTGYVSDGVWEFYAERKNGNELLVKPKSPHNLFNGTGPTSINFSVVKSSDGTDCFVKTIRAISYGFDGCKKNLTEFIAPHCTSIEGEETFADCEILTNVYLNESFNWATIPLKAFSGCKKLKLLHPLQFENVTKVDKYAFSSCSDFTEKLDFPKCKEILDNAFDGSSIEEIDAPNLEVIGYMAFKGCKSLKKVSVGDKLIQIASGAFNGCTSLNPDFLNDVIKKTLQYIGSKNLSSTYFGEEFKGCSTLTGPLIWDLPNLKTNIVGASCFRGCSSLEKVVFKTPVSEIRTEAFHGVKSGAEFYMHKKAPKVYATCAIGRSNSGTGTSYPKIYLQGSDEEIYKWLDVMGENNFLILRKDFNNKDYSDSFIYKGATKTANWANFASYMEFDEKVCAVEKSGSTITKLSVADKRVIGFLYYRSDTAYCHSWILKVPQEGLKVIVR